MMTRYKLFGEIKKEFTYIFKSSIFFESIKFYKFFRVVLLQILFGSGAARIRILNDFIRILLSKVSDPEF